MKRTSCLRNRAIYLHKRGPRFYESKGHGPKDPYVSAKDPCILLKEPCILLKEPHVSAKEPYIPTKEVHVSRDRKSWVKRALYFRQRALYSRQRAPHFCKRILHFHKRAQFSTRQKSDISAKESNFSAKEQHSIKRSMLFQITSKEPCNLYLRKRAPYSRNRVHCSRNDLTRFFFFLTKILSNQLCTLVLIVCIFFWFNYIVCTCYDAHRKSYTCPLLDLLSIFLWKIALNMIIKVHLSLYCVSVTSYCVYL